MRTNSSPFAFFARGSNPIVRANAAALALLATSLVAVVNAKVAGGRTVSTVVLDLIVWADVCPLALPVHRVSENSVA